MKKELRPHERPLIGLVCPRCHGQIVETYPGEEATCFQCGYIAPHKVRDLDREAMADAAPGFTKPARGNPPLFQEGGR